MNTQEIQDERAKMWAEADAGVLPTEAAPKTSEVVQAAPVVVEPAAAKLTAASPKDAEVAEDPYKDLPDSVRFEIAGLKSQLTKATDRQRGTDGRLGGLQSELRQLKEGLASGRLVAPTASATPSEAEVAAAQATPKAMAKLVEDYPEFGAAMKGALDEITRPLHEQLKALKSAPAAEAPMTREEIQSLTVNEQRKLRVEIEHPNWEKTVATPTFQGWLDAQPEATKALAASASPQDAIELLNLHSEALRPSARQQQRTQRLSAAAAIPNGRTPTLRTKPTDQMTKEEYWKHLDEIESQKG